MSGIVDAVRSQDAEHVRNLVNEGISPNEIDERTGDNLLTIAAESGNKELVQLLLDLGADPNATGTVTWPLHAAAGGGHEEVIDILLFADADIDAVDEDGVTALGAAAAAGHFRIVEMLLDAGANPRHKDRRGNFPANYALDRGNNRIVELLLPYSPPRVKRRLSLKREFRQQTVSQRSAQAFVDAAMRGEIDYVKALLSAGTPVDVLESEEGMTALMWAANRGQLEIVQYLLEQGANIDHTNAYGDSPLATAAVNGQGTVYDYLYPLTRPQLRPRAERMKQLIISRKQWKT
jgi:ankyrin repeat protein